MDWEQRCIRVCGAVVMLAILLRLTASGYLDPVAEAVRDPRAASFLVYLQTGRVVRLATPQRAEEEPTEPEATLPVFLETDLALLELTTTSNYQPDLENLLTRELNYDLSDTGPTVLILHTHTTESYTPTQGQTYEPSADYRTLDERYNMLRIGQEVARILEEAGVGVIQDRQLHDYPSYNDAYQNSAQSAAEYVARYPGIRLILDLHRDAAETGSGQLATRAAVAGKSSAQLMLVVGTDDGGLSHPDWQENLSLALKLQVVLEKENPGLCRDLALSWQRFNQHFAPGALLVEVGAAGNTLDEALVAAGALAEGILTLFGMG